MKINQIVFGSIDAINNCINSLEIKLNKLKNTPYNGFNYDDSFVNHRKIKQISKDIEYLKIKREEFLK